MSNYRRIDYNRELLIIFRIKGHVYNLDKLERTLQKAVSITLLKHTLESGILYPKKLHK